MGSDKQETQTQQTSTPQPTEFDLRQQELGVERAEAIQPGLISAQTTALDLISQLLAGTEPLPGFFEELSQGISPEIAESISQEAIRGLGPAFQQSGILESGVAGQAAARVKGDILRGAEEFNIGNRLNLLQLALSGQANVQTPLLQQQALLNQQLAGLRPITTTGQTSTVSQQGFGSTFVRPFAQGLGKAAGASFFGTSCWVASEIFGGWFKPRTMAARFYVNFIGPKWFRNLYLKFGERVANFIHNKPFFKAILKPLFEYFAIRGGYNA